MTPRVPAWLSDEDTRFFGFAIPVLERFASDHGLRAEPWFKDMALWALHFRHPRGGVAQIVVGTSGETASVSAVWWRDHFESETRYLSPSIDFVCSHTESELVSALEKALGSVAALTEQALVAYPMEKGTWHRHFTPDNFDEWERSLRRGSQ